MKFVKITNALVVPFYNSEDVVRVIDSKTEGEKVVTFQVQTTSRKDGGAKMYQQCVVFAKNETDVKKVKSTVIKDSIIEIEGTETSKYDGEKKKSYVSIIVTNIKTISNSPGSNNTNPDDDLPF